MCLSAKATDQYCKQVEDIHMLSFHFLCWSYTEIAHDLSISSFHILIFREMFRIILGHRHSWGTCHFFSEIVIRSSGILPTGKVPVYIHIYIYIYIFYFDEGYDCLYKTNFNFYINQSFWDYKHSNFIIISVLLLCDMDSHQSFPQLRTFYW